MEKNYKNLTEEVNDLKIIIKGLREKYQQGQTEIKDLYKENERDKEELNDIIRF